MSAAKDIISLIKDLEANGFAITPRDGTRYQLNAPDGDMTFVSTQGANGRKLANTLGWAKRHGYDPDKKQQKSSTPKPAPDLFPSTPRPAGITSPFEVPISEEPPVEPAPAVASVQVEAPATVTEAVSDPVVEPTSSPRAVTPLSGGALVVKLPEGHPAWPLPGAVLLPKGNGVLQEDRIVDPALAEAFLEFNRENRVPQKRLVDSWARTMVEGGWVEEVGDPIRFANTGKLLDGQKRLMALIKAGVSLQFSVITGLAESSQDVMDSGQKRSVADQLKINGYKNFMIVAAAARLLWMWEHGAVISGDPAPSNAEQLDFVLAVSGQNDAVSIEVSSSVASGSGAYRIIAPSVIAASHYKMSLVDSAAADEFWHMLGSGAGMPELSPVLALRETMQRRKDLRQRLTQGEQVFFVARAWQLWRAEAKVAKLQFPKDRLTMAHIPEIA